MIYFFFVFFLSFSFFFFEFSIPSFSPGSELPRNASLSLFIKKKSTFKAVQAPKHKKQATQKQINPTDDKEEKRKLFFSDKIIHFKKMFS